MLLLLSFPNFLIKLETFVLVFDNFQKNLNLIFFLGVYLDVEGKEKFKKGERNVIICNHQSLFDIFLITGFF